LARLRQTSLSRSWFRLILSAANTETERVGLESILGIHAKNNYREKRLALIWEKQNQVSLG